MFRFLDAVMDHSTDALDPRSKTQIGFLDVHQEDKYVSMKCELISTDRW
jgi:hypothetical protein